MALFKLHKFNFDPSKMRDGRDFSRHLDAFQDHIGDEIAQKFEEARKADPDNRRDNRGGGGRAHRWDGMLPYSIGSATVSATGATMLTADLLGLVLERDTPLFLGTAGVIDQITAITYDGRTQYIGPGGRLPALMFDPSKSDEYVALNLEGRATRQITITANSIVTAGTWYLWTYIGQDHRKKLALENADA